VLRFINMPVTGAYHFDLAVQCVGAIDRRLAESGRPAHHPSIKRSLGEGLHVRIVTPQFSRVYGIGRCRDVGAYDNRRQRGDGARDKFDLVIKGGDVLDPSQSLRGKRDIGIRWGVIEAVEPEIPAARALKTIDAAGKLVTPGLIDLHCHVYPYGSAIGIPADELVQFQGTTTVVSAGDAGVNNLAALRRYIVAQSRARIYAFVHIANNGLSAFPIAELYNIDNAQVEACAMALAENPDFLIGVKVRMSENVIFKHGLEPLKRGIQACEMCGWPAKMMVHIGGVETGELMSDILELLRPGDVLTHAYSGAPNIAGAFTNIVQDGKLLAGGARRQAARRDLRCRPWRRQLSTSRWRKSRFPPAARRTPSRPTSTCFPAIRRACRTCPT
jgi:hypothetical protein